MPCRTAPSLVVKNMSILKVFSLCRPWLISLLMLVAAQAGVADVPARVVSPTELAADLMKASDGREYGRLLREHMKNPSPTRLDEWERQTNDGLAIQAAWERIVGSMPPETTGSQEFLTVDPRLMQRFLGFVAGRLQVTLPTWWVRSFEEGKYRESGLWSVSELLPGVRREEWTGDESQDDEFPADDLQEVGFNIQGKVQSVTNGNDFVEVKAEDRVYRIPRSVLNDALEDHSGYNVIDVGSVDESTWIIAVHEDKYLRYPLYALTNKSEKPLWKATVFCEDTLIGGSTGSGFTHCTESVMDSKGRVLVFGANDFSMYIEGFDLRDGTPSFRFSTSYAAVHR